MGKTNSKGNFRGADDWLDREPQPFSVLTAVEQVATEVWANGEDKVDTGIPKSYPYYKPHPFTSFVGFAADQIERQREIATPEDELIARQQARCNLCHGCEQAEPIDPVKAAINLMRLIEVDPTPEMCHVVGAYIEEDMKRPVKRINGEKRQVASLAMDGVIHLYFSSANGTREAVLEFIPRLRTYVDNEFCGKKSMPFTPEISEEVGRTIFDSAVEEKKNDDSLISKIKALEISSNAKAQMISKAQREHSGNGNGNGPAYKLGEAIFGYRWKILLRGTV